MSKWKIGDTAYVDINENAARKVKIIAKRRFTYLLQDDDSISDGVLIKRKAWEMWRIPDPSLLKSRSKS